MEYVLRVVFYNYVQHYTCSHAGWPELDLGASKIHLRVVYSAFLTQHIPPLSPLRIHRWSRRNKCASRWIAAKHLEPYGSHRAICACALTVCSMCYVKCPLTALKVLRKQTYQCDGTLHTINVNYTKVRER